MSKWEICPACKNGPIAKLLCRYCGVKMGFTINPKRVERWILEDAERDELLLKERG